MERVAACAAGGGVAGPRPLHLRVHDARVERVLRTASTDPTVAEAFLRTVNLMRWRWLDPCPRPFRATTPSRGR